jgi:hypothetical protein
MTNSTPPAGRPTPSHDQIITENVAITACNQAHQACHNQGDANVENDESLLVIPPTFTNVSTNCTPVANNTQVGASSTVANSTTINPTLPSSSILNPSTPTPSALNTSYASMVAAFQRLSPNRQASLQSSINASTATSSSSNTSSLPTNTSSSLILMLSMNTLFRTTSIMILMVFIHTF